MPFKYCGGDDGGVESSELFLLLRGSDRRRACCMEPGLEVRMSDEDRSSGLMQSAMSH